MFEFLCCLVFCWGQENATVIWFMIDKFYQVLIPGLSLGVIGPFKSEQTTNSIYLGIDSSVLSWLRILCLLFLGIWDKCGSCKTCNKNSRIWFLGHPLNAVIRKVTKCLMKVIQCSTLSVALRNLKKIYKLNRFKNIKQNYIYIYLNIYIYIYIYIYLNIKEIKL